MAGQQWNWWFQNEGVEVNREIGPIAMVGDDIAGIGDAG